MWGPVRPSDIGATRADWFVRSAAYWAAFWSVNLLLIPGARQIRPYQRNL
jgi:hypothetical protein